MPQKPEFTNKLQIVMVAVCAGLLLACPFEIKAQDLEHLPPVVTQKATKDSATTFLFTVSNFSYFDGKDEETGHASAVEIIDADQPWPPRWYTATPYFTPDMYEQEKRENHLTFNIYGMPQIEKDYIFFGQPFLARHLDTTKFPESQIEPSFRVLNKHLEFVDSLRSCRFYGGSYGPNFRNDTRIQQLTTPHRDSIIDFSNLTGDPGDKRVECVYYVFDILDSRDNTEFLWSPLDHMDPKYFPIKEQLSIRSNTPGRKPQDMIVKLAALGLGPWDHDGNLLYNLEYMGIGKFSRADGHVMWHAETANMPVISGRDTFECYNPWDLKFLSENDSSVIYTVFDQKVDTASFGRGVVFEVNKNTNALKVLKYINAKKKYHEGERHQKGGFDYNLKTGEYLIDYGIYGNTNESDSLFEDAFQYGKGDSVYAIFRTPKFNYTLGGHKLENWPLPERPKILKKGNQLEAAGNFAGWTWYRLTGASKTKVKSVGHGSTITPEKGASYCVAGPYGMGYCVSKVFTYMP
jgi:hypothetical protein